MHLWLKNSQIKKEGNFFILKKDLYEENKNSYMRKRHRLDPEQSKDVHSHFLFNIVLEVPVSTTKEREKIKRYPDCNWRSETIFLFLSTYDHICRKS